MTDIEVLTHDPGHVYSVEIPGVFQGAVVIVIDEENRAMLEVQTDPIFDQSSVHVSLPMTKDYPEDVTIISDADDDSEG